METVTSRLNALRAEIPAGVELVAVSKFHPAEALMEAYHAGQRVFGESRAVEFVNKTSILPPDISWHFIGHLQTNKVRTILPHVSLIHSVDSARLLRLIDTDSARIGKTTDVLMQLHVAREETKFGLTPEEMTELLSPDFISSLTNTRIIGVMGMASNVDDEERIRHDFREIRETFDRLRATSFADRSEFQVVSMGMSHDWRIAVDEGSTMIRVGTTIFGEREY